MVVSVDIYGALPRCLLSSAGVSGFFVECCVACIVSSALFMLCSFDSPVVFLSLISVSFSLSCMFSSCYEFVVCLEVVGILVVIVRKNIRLSNPNVILT